MKIKCIICSNEAEYIHNGDSLCQEHFKNDNYYKRKGMEIIKKYKKSEKSLINLMQMYNQQIKPSLTYEQKYGILYKAKDKSEDLLGQLNKIK
jgi:hypothetical protein